MELLQTAREEKHSTIKNIPIDGEFPFLVFESHKNKYTILLVIINKYKSKNGSFLVKTFAD